MKEMNVAKRGMQLIAAVELMAANFIAQVKSQRSL
jgi:hypothetical protein